MITWLEGQRERSLDYISVEETLRYSGPWLLPNRDRSYTLKDLSSFRHISFIYHEKMGWNWSKYNFKWCFRWGPSAVSHLCSAVFFLIKILAWLGLPMPSRLRPHTWTIFPWTLRKSCYSIFFIISNILYWHSTIMMISHHFSHFVMWEDGCTVSPDAFKRKKFSYRLNTARILSTCSKISLS